MGKNISNDECAFFIFPHKGCHAFWNKNVEFDLTLVFVDDKFKIVDVQTMKKGSEAPIYPNNRNIKYVLEVHAAIIGDNVIGNCVGFDADTTTITINEDHTK